MDDDLGPWREGQALDDAGRQDGAVSPRVDHELEGPLAIDRDIDGQAGVLVETRVEHQQRRI